MMIQLTRIFSALVIAIALLMAGARTVHCADLQIVLKENVACPQQEWIVIGDVADVIGGAPIQRQQIAQLDLDRVDHQADQCVISMGQVRTRILLEGFRRDQFTVSGAQQSSIRCVPLGAPSFTSRVQESIAKEIARQFAMQPQSIAVRLQNESQIETLSGKLTSDEFGVTVVVQPQLPFGKTQIQVEFTQQTGQRFSIVLDTQVIVSLPVAISTQSITRGTAIDESMFQVIRRPIARRESFASPDALIGQTATRDIGENEVLLSTYLSNRPVVREPLVKRNDLLDVVIDLDGNEIRLRNAKAMSAGSKGDSIAVLNTNSNKQFSAVVIDKNLARVEIPRGMIR
ncbi:flagellar basal body P-ring formation chaperone FlgA [Stieleria varia]|uniref:Flagellar basal body P-ring biosynthesis protein FlgA n=1 Tax=Stieleria varia TaxID=2528005 RepID=A0A5C6AQZ0_9BACT|nr:flagellar basal body P-ring formation chaperone FlgA [Stieleria varia]TWU02375.1 flagellar basal body P-ring biosynthesis protein FlgA [Stieleria varia]